MTTKKTEIEEKKEEIIDEDIESIKVIKEEYAKKIQELEEKHIADLKEQEKRLEEKHAKQIRALFLEGTPSSNQPEQIEEDEKTFYERVEEKMRKKLKI